MCESAPGPSKQTKRPAIFVAEPPRSSKYARTEHDKPGVICGKAATSKKNPLQQPSQESWNILAKKSEEWRELNTDFSNLYERIQLDKTPRKVHKICKLDVTGIKLKRAQELHSKYPADTSKDTQTSEDVSPSSNLRIRRITCKVSKFSCVICEKKKT